MKVKTWEIYCASNFNISAVELSDPGDFFI